MLEMIAVSELAEIRAMVSDLQRSTGRIEGSLSSMKTTLADRDDQNEKRLDDHATRLRKVENRQHYWAGASAVIGALVTIFIKRNVA